MRSIYCLAAGVLTTIVATSALGVLPIPLKQNAKDASIVQNSYHAAAKARWLCPSSGDSGWRLLVRLV